MNTAEIVNSIVYLLVPVVIAMSAYYYKKVEQILPDKQRQALQEISKLVVHSIEQQYSSAEGERKLNYAISMVIKFFSALQLPVPAQKIIETAIEAAVFEMNMFQSPKDNSDLFMLTPPPSQYTTLPYQPTESVVSPPPPPSTSTTLPTDTAQGGDNHVA